MHWNFLNWLNDSRFTSASVVNIIFFFAFCLGSWFLKAEFCMESVLLPGNRMQSIIEYSLPANRMMGSIIVYSLIIE